ncbi:MAG: FeoA domain-containing protein [Balneolales bacterium]
MHPLTAAILGEEIDIQCLACSSQNACKLREMGCVEGLKGKLISNGSKIIFQVGETRLAISTQLAHTILVRSK